MAKPRAPDVFVALLRGINVGGKNKLPMKALAEMFTGAGCRNVETYIQSGNVVFEASKTRARRIDGVVARQIEDEFGYSIPVVTRSRDELDAVIDANPYLRRGAETKRLHVAFLAASPAAERIDALDPGRSPGDRFTVAGREIYLDLPQGVGRSKLTNQYFDSKLGTISTIRNWRTVLELQKMAHAVVS